MPRVYIPNKTMHDFSGAAKFGELVFLYGDRINIYNPADMLIRVRDVLRDSTAEDRIVVSGLPIVLSLLTAEFALTHMRVNYLIFNGGRGVYEPREVVFPDH